MEGSGVGRGCCALMMPVIFKGRALPLAWRVRQCPKGHFPEDLHIALVELVSNLIPAGTKVVFLGDGEFDGIKLQETMHEAGWWYACRTSKGNTATWDDETFYVDELGACLKPGRLIELKEVQWTREAYGPVLLLRCWHRGRPSRGIGSGICLQRRRRSMMIRSVSASRHFFQIRKVEGSIFRSRISQTLSVCLGYSSRHVWPTYGECIEDP